MFWHPIVTFQQGLSDLYYALYAYMECMRAHGWMCKFLSKYSEKREHNQFICAEFLEDIRYFHHTSDNHCRKTRVLSTVEQASCEQ